MKDLEASKLESIGMEHYRAGDFEQAVAALKALTASHPSMWNSRLYLGMAYSKMGRISHAIQEFRDISEWCQDPDLRAKAATALKAMNQISSSRMESLSKQKVT